jgi:hypothetical protein
MARDPLSSLKSLEGSSTRIEALARRTGIDVKKLDKATRGVIALSPSELTLVSKALEATPDIEESAPGRR